MCTTAPRLAYGLTTRVGLRCPSTWSTPFWESSSTTKIALFFQYGLCEMVSTMRPTARSLSATWASGVMPPGVVPAVWSFITHSMFSAGRLPFFTYPAKSLPNIAARYWSGMLRSKLGKFGLVTAASDGMSVLAV